MYRTPKDPNGVISRGFDWTNWLDGDSITASTWTAPEDGELEVVAQGYTETSTSVRLSGGVKGKIYPVVNRITTNEGDVEDETLYVHVN